MTSEAHSEEDLEPTGLRAIAELLATETAELVKEKRAQLTGQGDLRDFAMSKSSLVDPVTIVDTLAEDHLVERITELRPQDGIIGEEGADKASMSGVSWVIDPIDGTVNFIYGLPHYAVSVAAALNGEVVAGAVVNVVTGERYSAAVGEGATVQRAGAVTTLRANAVEEPAMALVATGFSYSSRRREQQGAIVARLVPQVRDIRRIGSAALDLCHLAEGRVDGYYEHGIHCWDYAAGALIAREAGAVVEAPALSVSGDEGNLTKAAAPRVAEAFFDALSHVGADQKLPG